MLPASQFLKIVFFHPYSSWICSVSSDGYQLPLWVPTATIWMRIMVNIDKFVKITRKFSTKFPRGRVNWTVEWNLTIVANGTAIVVHSTMIAHHNERVRLVVFYGILTLDGYLMLNPVYKYILNIYMICK